MLPEARTPTFARRAILTHAGIPAPRSALSRSDAIDNATCRAGLGQIFNNARSCARDSQLQCDGVFQSAMCVSSAPN